MFYPNIKEAQLHVVSYITTMVLDCNKVNESNSIASHLSDRSKVNSFGIDDTF